MQDEQKKEKNQAELENNKKNFDMQRIEFQVQID